MKFVIVAFEQIKGNKGLQLVDMNMVLVMQIHNEQNHFSITYIKNNTYHTLTIILETQFWHIN